MSENRKIQVVLLEPGKQAKVTEIDASLAGMQAVVGGDIEITYPFAEEVCVVCNDEGKIMGLPLNRALRAEEDMGSIQRGEIFEIIAGPFFLCDCSGENLASLTDEQCRRYAKKFRWPENFIKLRGGIIAVPMKDPRDMER